MKHISKHSLCCFIVTTTLIITENTLVPSFSLGQRSSCRNRTDKEADSHILSQNSIPPKCTLPTSIQVSNKMVAPGTSRVPAALQAIFMQSQRGEDVEKIKPPPRLGFRIFYAPGNKRPNPLKKKKSIQAPATSALYQERHGNKETAAVASRRAIKARGDDGSMSVSDLW